MRVIWEKDNAKRGLIQTRILLQWKGIDIKLKKYKIYKFITSRHPIVSLLFLFPSLLLGYVLASNINAELDFRENHKKLLVVQSEAVTDTEVFFVNYIRDCYVRPGLKVENCIERYVNENPQGVSFQTMDSLTKTFLFDLVSYKVDRAKLIAQ
jgi:hypothetical protein